MKFAFLFSSISLLFCWGLFSCSGAKDVVSEPIERSFIIGSGGGFTGAYETYRVHSSGKVEQQNPDMESYSFLKNIPLDSAVIAITELEKLSLLDYSFDHPDNMTFFIEIEGGEEAHTIKWGAADHTVRPDVKTFFKRMRKMIRASYTVR